MSDLSVLDLTSEPDPEPTPDPGALVAHLRSLAIGLLRDDHIDTTDASSQVLATLTSAEREVLVAVAVTRITDRAWADLAEARIRRTEHQEWKRAQHAAADAIEAEARRMAAGVVDLLERAPTSP